MGEIDEAETITFRPRVTEPVMLSIPVDAMEEIRRVAASRDMSAEALLKFYIGQGLRQDTTRAFGRRAGELTQSHRDTD